MKMNWLGECGFGKPNWFLAIVLAVCGLAGASANAEEALGAPNSLAIFEQARIAEHRVLFSQDFEKPVADDYMRIWYVAPGCQCRIVFAGVSEEQAFSSKRSYKVQVELQPTEVPKFYIRLLLQIPIWSDLKLSWRIRTETSSKVASYPSHGFSDGEAGGSDGNVAAGIGSKVSEENG